MLGILLIDKPPGITSHDAVHQVRRRLGTKRVGHAGTLDPLATGLLVIAVGPATRFLQYLPLEPKVYECAIAFGIETNTQDAEGTQVAGSTPPPDLQERFAVAKESFLGLIQQVPPMFSAVKKEGKPLYVLARKGVEIEREPRTVHIASIEELGWERDIAQVRIVCSGGTYVRTIAHELGRTIGCGAHLAALRRTAAGSFSVMDALRLEDVAPERLIPLASALAPMPMVALSADQCGAIRQGRSVAVSNAPAGRLAGLVDPQGDVIGVAKVIGNQLQPECVIPLEAAP